MMMKLGAGSPRAALGLSALVGALSVGCDASSGNAGRMTGSVQPNGTAALSVGAPAEWLSFRMVDLNALQLLVTLDGVPQASTRTASDQWQVAFVLPDDNSHTIQATWQEQLPDRLMTLAVSQEIPISNVQPEPGITISEYQHREFDEDNDGISNLDERRLGLEPLIPDLVTPGPDQSDCRANTPSIDFGNFFVDVTTPAFAAPLAVTSSATLSNLMPAQTDGQLAVFESFFVLAAGELTISHFGGPSSTGAIVYDTNLNGSVRILGRDNIPQAMEGATFENRRAVTTAQVSPGLYCYRLESTQFDEQIINPSLQYSFVAAP